MSYVRNMSRLEAKENAANKKKPRRNCTKLEMMKNTDSSSVNIYLKEIQAESKCFHTLDAQVKLNEVEMCFDMLCH